MFILKPTQQNLIGLIEHLQPQALFDVVFHYDFEGKEANGDEAVGIIRTISFPQGSTSTKFTKSGSIPSSQSPQTPTKMRASVVPKRDHTLQAAASTLPSSSTNFRSRIIATPASIDMKSQTGKSGPSPGMLSYTHFDSSAIHAGDCHTTDFCNPFSR